MIEFRAACGHSIRAKEEDAGKTVRCNYCGASVQVPDPSASSLDYLFATEAEQATERGVQARQRARKSGGPRIPIIGNMLNETNPVRLMLTFVYIGIVLVVLGVGGRLLYSYAKGYLAERKAGRPVVSRAPSQGTAGGRGLEFLGRAADPDRPEKHEGSIPHAGNGWYRALYYFRSGRGVGFPAKGGR